MLLRIPYIEIDTVELIVQELQEKWGKLHGLIATYSPENVEFNIRCASRIRDRFPNTLVYIAVPAFKTYEKLKTIYNAGFKHIVVPQYLGKVQYDHYFQFISVYILDSINLHIAGGKFDSEHWNRPEWTWSREKL